MAIACFLLVTFFPLPLFSVPRLRLRIADSTSFDALFDVFRLAGLANCHDLRSNFDDLLLVNQRRVLSFR
jgi:hypothetical protein